MSIFVTVHLAIDIDQISSCSFVFLWLWCNVDEFSSISVLWWLLDVIFQNRAVFYCVFTDFPDKLLEAEILQVEVILLFE